MSDHTSYPAIHSLSFRTSNRLADFREAFQRLEWLRRAHSAAIDTDVSGCSMPEVLAIGRAVRDAEKDLNAAVKAYATARLALQEASDAAAAVPAVNKELSGPR